MNTPRTQDHPLTKLRELIKDIPIASLVTVESDGTLRARPMATQAMEDEPVLWFFTNDHSAKVEEVRAHAQVCLIYAAPDKSRYVSISGTAELVHDRTKIDQLWKPLHKAWFPQGKDDPNLALLRVDFVSAEYWDSPGSKLVQIFGLAKAAVTGKPATDVGEHEHLTVRKRIGADTVT